MRVEILLNGQLINTQLVSVGSAGGERTLTELKRVALKAALNEGAISISQSLLTTFRIFDATGKPLLEQPDPPRHRQ